MRGLKDKIIVITGGLGDLGYATAVRMAEEGCVIVLVDLQPDADHKVSALGAHFWQLDIRDETAVAETCAAIEREIGPAHVLINTAARFIFKGVDATADEWQQINAVNIGGTSLMTKYIVPQMKKNGGGSIINFSSVSGFVGQASFATYNATKFAIRGLTKCWAQDLAPFGIRVNTLCPGYIYTRAFINSCEKLGLDIDEEDRRASAMHLLNRQGRPEEVAAAAAFLASDDSSFMTGSDLLVDGGYLAK
ncbi:dihydroanticapsin dehydrogenase [Larkinella arboricola]|uniref:Dihydroanticapsin dehydrogenase n=1 Tax=Larkinella arboricola TaxID=643671 RepID=A0A327WNH6_LARAB|nr:SDR family oxidoreductase [Larkinella arboricola]RAJ93155.1 dihydroanticapsin dehydrogenase [Larkinella arboricola]